MTTHLSFSRVIDLTRPLTDRMPVYPGDPPVRVDEMAHLESDGFTVARLTLNDHAGTHLETQYHMRPGKRLIDEPPDRFIGQAAVVPVPGSPVAGADLGGYEPLIRRNPYLLLYTGYSERTDAISPDDPHRPVVSLDALRWLCDRGIRLLGIDAFDFDSGPPYPGHHLLFEREVLVLEGLVGLRELAGQEVTLLVLPLKVEGTGASPCRVLALA